MPSEVTQFKSGSAHHFGQRDRCSSGHLYLEGSFKIVDKDGYSYRHCRVCSRLATKRAHQMRYYGITQEQRDDIFVKQGSCCAICKSKYHGGRGWHTDHDHVTKKVRGILCHPCNLALGNVKDNVEILQALIEYLRGTEGREQRAT
jgi:hypothetical protein